MVADLIWAVSLAMGCGGTPKEHQIPVYRHYKYSQKVDTLGVESIVPAPAARAREGGPVDLRRLWRQSRPP